MECPFSHHSALLVSGSSDKTVKIWDASTGECLQTFEGHRGDVNSVAFSHHSALLASGSSDKTVKIWDISSGECLQTLKGHSGIVNSVAFSHDLAWLASSSDDNTVKIWDASSGECQQTLEIGNQLFNISFDTTGSYLHTDIGTIAVDILPLNSIPSVTGPQNPQYQGGTLSSNGSWIKYNSENLAWLPSEYRPTCSAVSGKMIGVSLGSGKVWICNFKVDDS
jgi:WD40 repeat protein